MCCLSAFLFENGLSQRLHLAIFPLTMRLSQTRGTIETWRVYLCHPMDLCYRVGLWGIPCNRQVSQLSEWKRACTVWCVLLLHCLETRMCHHPCAAGCIYQPVYFPMFHHSYGEGELTIYQSLAWRARLMIMVRPKLDIII